jgi:lipid II:glycine glycyltransferase (peptidoglycan interpeptide bridge formation enzyme)
LIACLGGKLNLRVALKNDTPLASMITLAFNGVVTYKYGCSDSRFNALGGPTFLFWETIKDALVEGARELDFGRSDYENPGLIAFKDHWGASRSDLTYYRHPPPPERVARQHLRMVAWRLVAKVPDPVLAALGGLFYRHAG